MPSAVSASRRAWSVVLLTIGYACLCAGYLAWVWSHDITDLGGDSAMYVLLGRHFSPFFAPSPVLETMVRGTAYPPLFPFLIGLSGGGLLAGHLLAAASLLGALPCLAGWLRAEGVKLSVSAWTATLFALMPATYFLTLNIWTENTYLLFCLVAILAEQRASAPDDRRSHWWWTAAAAVAAATLTRSAALPLLAAFLLRLLLVRPGRWPVFAALSCAPFAIQAGWSWMHQSGVSNYLAQWSGSYSGHAMDQLWAQLRQESYLAGVSWIRAWLGQDLVRTPALHVLAGIGVVCLLGWLRRLRQLRFDALYTLLYAMLLLAWPFPAEAARLSYVLIPVLLASGVLLFQEARHPPLWHGAIVLLGALSIIALPTLLITAQRFMEPLPENLEPARHLEEYYGDNRPLAMFDAEEFTATLQGLRDIVQVVPATDCIFSTKPSLVALYSERISLAPPPVASPDESFNRLIGTCHYAYLRAATSPSFAEPMYPMRRLGQRARTLYATTDANNFTFTALIAIDPP
jgi:hypothetical protein